MMPCHADRVRRNYPEGVPAFGQGRSDDGCPECHVITSRWQHLSWCYTGFCSRSGLRKQVDTVAKVVSPELICAVPVTEPPAVNATPPEVDICDFCKCDTSLFRHAYWCISNLTVKINTRLGDND